MTPGGSESRPIAAQTIQPPSTTSTSAFDERGEHLRPPPAEAPLRRRRPMREPGGEEGQPERERVREHVRRVGEERQRVGGDADERLDAGEAEHERQRERERTSCSPPCVTCTAGTVTRAAL